MREPSPSLKFRWDKPHSFVLWEPWFALKLDAGQGLMLTLLRKWHSDCILLFRSLFPCLAYKKSYFPVIYAVSSATTLLTIKQCVSDIACIQLSRWHFAGSNKGDINSQIARSHFSQVTGSSDYTIPRVGASSSWTITFMSFGTLLTHLVSDCLLAQAHTTPRLDPRLTTVCREHELHPRSSKKYQRKQINKKRSFCQWNIKSYN